MILGTVREVEIEGVTFTVRPEEFEDFLACMEEESERRGDADGVDVDSGGTADVVALRRLGILMVRRIVAWQGIELPGNLPAPCTRENKERLFGQHPALVPKLVKALADAEEAEKKTSENSAAG